MRRPWTFILMLEFFLACQWLRKYLVLPSDFHCAPRVRTTGPNNDQRVLQGCPPSSAWCCWSMRPELWSIGNWRLHYDTSPAHSLHLIQTFLAKNQTPVVRKAPCSPDMAPCDFWLFIKLKRSNVGYFSNNENLTRAVNTITQMLLAINWHCWQAEKNSRMRMKVQGGLIHMRFI